MKNQVDAMRNFSEEDGIAHFLNSSLTRSAIDVVKEDETRLTKKDDDYLTYTLMNPHKIEAKFHLDVIDLFNIDFTHPIFLAQFGQIYYIEEIKFNAEESEVTLVELKNTDYR
jgi:hypothetical protein